MFCTPQHDRLASELSNASGGASCDQAPVSAHRSHGCCPYIFAVGKTLVEPNDPFSQHWVSVGDDLKSTHDATGSDDKKA